MKKIIVPLMMLFLASCSNPSSSSDISNDLSSMYVNPGIQESFSTQTYELYNQDCQQIYLLIVEGDNSYIKNKNTEEVVERFSNNDNPYLKGDYAYMIYVDDPEYSDLYKHIAVIDNELYDLDNEQFIPKGDDRGKEIIYAVDLLSDRKMYTVYNQDCQDKYLLIVEQDTSILIEKKTSKEIEVFRNEDNPYLKEEYQYMIYVDDPNYSQYKHIAVIDNELYDLDNEQFIPKGNDKGGSIGDYLDGITSYMSVPSSATKCDYYQYFGHLSTINGYGENNHNTCCLVSMQILFGYYDSIHHDQVIDEDFDNEQYYPSLSWTGFPYSPSSYGYEFHEYLISLCNFYYDIDGHVDGTMTMYQQYNMIRQYIGVIQDLDCVDNCSYTIADILAGNQFWQVTSAINSGRPVIVNNHNHSMVAYAYDDDYIYLMTGWPSPSGYAKMLWSNYNGNIFTNLFCGAFDLFILEDHVCSDNYHSLMTGNTICPVCD